LLFLSGLELMFPGDVDLLLPSLLILTRVAHCIVILFILTMADTDELL
jgi:hypothetical protein